MLTFLPKNLVYDGGTISVHTENWDSELELLSYGNCLVYFLCEMSRMPPGHVRKQPLVESMALGDLLRPLQHTDEGESKGKAANCKELRKNVYEECGPLQIKGLLDLANQVFEN